MQPIVLQTMELFFCSLNRIRKITPCMRPTVCVCYVCKLFVNQSTTRVILATFSDAGAANSKKEISVGFSVTAGICI
jgi:hypothetical protein